MISALEGIRVVELADHVFVPSAGGILADWGADVIKVEHHEHGDLVRGFSSGPGVAGNVNLLYENSNRGKRSIGLNIIEEEGLEILYDLVKQADVFLTSKLPSVRKKLRVDAAVLQALNPKLVYVVGSATGSRGPGAGNGGYDTLCFWHRSGASLNVSGPGAPPHPFTPGVSFGDLTGGMAIAGGVTLALLQRERTGHAPTVDVSLLGTGLWTQGNTVPTALLEGKPFSPPTPAAPTNPLAGIFETKDGHWISLAALQGFKYWAQACDIIGRPDLVDDERFATAESFFEHAPEGFRAVADAIRSDTFDAWKVRFATFEGQWAPVQNSIDVATDPEVIANRILVDCESSDGTPMRVVTAPVQLDGAEGTPTRPPQFNEHCDEILVELGKSIDEQLDLKIRGIVA
jgi:crotonobetainyl-CoA:carnitine CoA-transferase CaiB-like acyl-CoA transferase